MVAVQIDPVRAKAWVRSALDHREGWVVTGHLPSESDGVIDETHRVVNQGDSERGEDWYQQEWGPLPGNTIDRIGLTVGEAQALL